MIGYEEDIYFKAEVSVYQEQNPVEVHAMNVAPQSYGSFYNPNARWSHLGFSYKNTTAAQNQNTYPKQPFQGNQFQRYPNPPQQPFQ